MKAALATGLLLVSASLLSAQDAVKVDPSHHQVILENEYVRVIRITVPAGEKTLQHAHPANAVIFLADANMRSTRADAQPIDNRRKANEVALNNAMTHFTENTGSTPSEAIMVELKKSPPGAAMKADAVKVDPKHYKVVAENDHFRVLHATYGAGEKSMMHEHPALVAIALTDETFKMNTPDGKSMMTPLSKRGEATYTDAVTHLPENVGRAPAEVMLVELKPAKS